MSFSNLQLGNAHKKLMVFDIKRWGVPIHSLGSSFSGLVESMVITFSLDKGGGLY